MKSLLRLGSYRKSLMPLTRSYSNGFSSFRTSYSSTALLLVTSSVLANDYILMGISLEIHESDSLPFLKSKMPHSYFSLALFSRLAVSRQRLQASCRQLHFLNSRVSFSGSCRSKQETVSLREQMTWLLVGLKMSLRMGSSVSLTICLLPSQRWLIEYFLQFMWYLANSSAPAEQSIGPVNQALELDSLTSPPPQRSILLRVITKQLSTPSQLKQRTLRGGQVSLFLVISWCFRSIYNSSCLYSQAQMVLQLRLSSVAGPPVQISWVSFSMQIQLHWQIIIMESENDKIKYWKYKLTQKQKNAAANEPFKAKPCKAKSPDKKKTLHPAYLQDNFFSNTLDKLKHLLEEEPSKKHEGWAHTKRSKDNVASKSTMRTNTEPGKKAKTADLNRVGKSMSIVNTIKIAKKTMEVDKNRVQKSSPSPKKSKSKSLTKKYRGDKSKELTVKHKQKESSPTKKSVKKKVKSKGTLKKAETIHLSSFSDTEPIDHRPNQSVIVHEIGPHQQGLLYQQSNFKKWEEQEQRQLVQSNKMGNLIGDYIHGFVDYARYARTTSPEHYPDKKNSRFSLKTIIKSQEQKLLELKDYLKQLKGSQNLNDSLEIIIGKVNENIVGLKEMEQGAQSRSERDLSNKRIAQREQVEQIQDQKEYLSPQQWHQPEPILMINSICINLEHNSQGYLQPQGIFDSKQDECPLPKPVHAILIENGQQVNEQNTTNETVFQKERSLMLVQYGLKSNDKSSLLLSAESKSQLRLLSPDTKTTPVINISISSFKCQQQEAATQRQPEAKYYKQSDCQRRQELEGNIQMHNFPNKIQEQKIPLSSITLQMRAILCDQILTCLIGQFIDCFDNHKEWLDKLVGFNNAHGSAGLTQVKTDFNEIDWPIQSSNGYLIQLAAKVLDVADDLGFRERIARPLGVDTLTTLKYMRHFDQSDNIQLSFDEEFDEIDRYVEILDQEDFQHFEVQCSCNPDHAEQLILNRCLYDVLNVLLDQQRPYGSKGRPAFCFGEPKHQPPSLSKIQAHVAKQLKRILSIRLGILQESGLSEQEMREAISKSLGRYNTDLIQEIERQYCEQADDGLQTYELMMMIEAQMLTQQAWGLLMLQDKRAGLSHP